MIFNSLNVQMPKRSKPSKPDVIVIDDDEPKSRRNEDRREFVSRDIYGDLREKRRSPPREKSPPVTKRYKETYKPPVVYHKPDPPVQQPPVVYRDPNPAPQLAPYMIYDPAHPTPVHPGKG